MIKSAISHGFKDFFRLRGYTSTRDLTVWIIFEVLCWFLIIVVAAAVLPPDAAGTQLTTPIMWICFALFWIGSALLAIGAMTSIIRWLRRDANNRFVRVQVGLLTGYKCPCGHMGIDFSTRTNSNNSARSLACPKCPRLADENTLQVLPTL